MQDLNDLYYYVEVVAHGGFAPAGRALGQPKSKLSRRIAQLEDRLGVRLIERSTRRFRVTDAGQAFYERCRAVLLEAEGAYAVAAETKGEPHGLVRFSCPTGMLESVRPAIAAFLDHYPAVRLQVVATNKAVDLIEQNIDVALRVRSRLDSDASLTMRTLGMSRRILVAAPNVAALLADGGALDTIATLPTLSSAELAGEEAWILSTEAGEAQTIRHHPRLSCGEIEIVLDAAVRGLGIALLPDHLCREALESGQLVHLFQGLHGPSGVIHLVFTTKRGLPPAVRAFIDHLATAFRRDIVVSPAPPRGA